MVANATTNDTLAPKYPEIINHTKLANRANQLINNNYDHHWHGNNK